MKILTALLIGVAVGVQAQVKLITFEEAHKSGISSKHLDSVYQTTYRMKLDKRTEYFKSQQQFIFKLNDLTRRLRTRQDNAMIWGRFYVNEEGRTDYLLYRIEGSLTPATKTTLLDSLSVLLNKFRFEGHQQSKHSFFQSIQVGLARQLPKGDSTLITPEQAEATTRPDTVKVLALNQLEISEVPYGLIYKFPNLQELNLSGNLLKSINLDFSKLPKLKHLWLNNNRLVLDSIKFTPNETIKVINLQGNKLADVPASLKNCKKLTSLWLGYNPLSKLNDDSFAGMKRLQDLNLYSCELTQLPNGIKKLKRLEVLDLYYNRFNSLPKSVLRLKRLQQLALSHNEVLGLPKQIGRLKRLQILYVHHNKLEQLPKSIGRLRSLQIFDIGHNRFSVLPREVGNLKRIEEFDASYNNLSEIPKAVLQMPNLKKLHLRENPFADDEMLLSRSKPVLDVLAQNKIDVYY